ncbi:PQQ-like beta-propeller repeat protein, partial [bacterium]|nr:PQQ-like beta-propeller repeat protein [bacterium]
MEVMSFVLSWLVLLLSPLEPGGELALQSLTEVRGTELVSEEFRVVEATPTQGTTFVVLEDDGYLLSRMAGAGGLAWRLPLPAEPSQLLAVGEGLVAVGTSDGGVVVVNASGTVLFSGKLPGGGSVKLALVIGEMTEDEESGVNRLVVLGVETGAVLPLDFSDDGLLFTLQAEPTTFLATIGNTITYGDAEGIVTLDTSGKILCRYPLLGSVRVPPVVSRGLVYFAAGDN